MSRAKKGMLNEGLPGLNELIAQVKNIPVKVLKRGSLRNTDEWYAVQELLNRMDSDLSATDRARLEQIAATFGREKRK